MNETRRGALAGPTSWSRFGLSHAALTAAIAAELEEAEDGQDPAAIASAVASAIEANNQELLRQLNQMLAADVVSTPPGRDEDTPEEP